MENGIRVIRGGGVTSPRGFSAAAVGCGIKDPANRRLDLALVACDGPAVTAGAFTTSRVKAAPVRVSQVHLRAGSDVRAVVINSGNANACTGPQGIRDAKEMVKAVSTRLGLRMRQVVVCSTGIIGLPMPMGRVMPRFDELIDDLSPSVDGSKKVAHAIMTSDTKQKSYAIEVELDGVLVRIGAVAKGAGMICPSMATMLCVVTTDAVIGRDELRRASLEAVDQSFNRITIDGDTSTNDSVIVMASGKAGNRAVANGSELARIFREALTRVMLELAKRIVMDGERVTKFVEVRVCGGRTSVDARRVAEAVGNSLLVKCSWAGDDPNWGRIMHAIGYSRARVREELVDIYLGGLCACKSGVASDTPPADLKRAVSRPQVTVCIDLNQGERGYTLYTTDLTEGYVSYNRSEYSLVERVLAERKGLG
jgi:glutamate N-acetyltransferase / amino-acid N-acetyltransferase